MSVNLNPLFTASRGRLREDHKGLTQGPLCKTYRMAQNVLTVENIDESGLGKF